MSQEEREAWDGYFAAAITGLLAKPAPTNPNAPSGMASNTKAITDKAARIADEMLEERRSR